MYQKTRAGSLIFLIAAATLFSGCATPSVEYGDPLSQQALSTDFGSADLQQIAATMVDSLITFPPVAEITATRRPVISVDRIKNKSMQHIDMEAVTDSIRARLIKSGKFTFVDRTTEAAVLEELKYQQNSGMVDQEKAVEMGKQYGAEYILSGNFAEIEHKVDDVRDVYYKFTLNLKNLRTGLLEWSDEKEIRKVWKRSTFGR
ncbi:lipoprotein, putative [Geotalea daltonii FRC-32]|uniref:Penicillin-binding protein activator LpoB n=1 Tax=Geotalea daltonii (strain DSM 22248 / JCM 15807 / FRC-32) TaxID=316067 RepID=B9M4B1_GEODF|nr:penicillin-binding protein activator LpoB [Geotalea daltonii]ACM21566.1 lipoprotein, putative [Geotalea daltonii FRC-32]